MKVKTNEEILFEAYLQSIGYSTRQSIREETIQIVSKKGWSTITMIATITFKDGFQTIENKNNIQVKGYGCPVTVTGIVKQMKSIFNTSKIVLTFVSDFPSES